MNILCDEKRETIRNAVSNIAFVAKQMMEEGDEQRGIILKIQCFKILECANLSLDIEKLKEDKSELEKEINGIVEKL